MTGEGAAAGLLHLLRSVGGPQASLTNTDALSNFFGFYGAGFLVVPTSPASTNVRILAGMGAKRDATDLPASISGIAGLDELADVKPVVLRQDIPSLAVPPAPSSPNQRIDIIEVAVRRDLYDTAAVNFLDVPSAKRKSLSVPKTLSYAVDPAQVPIAYVNDPAPSTSPIGYKVGQAGNPPTAPTVTPGYVQIATILVDNVVGNPAGTIQQLHIADWRPMLFLGGTAHFSLTASFPQAGGVPTIIHASVPPGIRLAVSRPSGANIPSCLIYVLNNLRDAILSGISPSFGVGPTNFDLTLGTQASGTTIGGGDQAQINNAALTTPTQLAAAGQPARLIQTYNWHWNGTAFSTSTTDPVVFTAAGTLT
jgi:hypothetical protein